MKYKYELACQDAGLTEEQTRKIRNFLDGEKKKVKRSKAHFEKEGISFNCIDLLTETEEANVNEATLGTKTIDIEELLIHREDLQRLEECLNRLTDKEREIIFAIFEEEKCAVSRASEKLGMNRSTVNNAKKRIIAKLQKYFFEN